MALAHVYLASLAAVGLLALGADAFRLSGCSFKVNGGKVPSLEPLYLKTSGPLNINGYVLPDGSGNIYLEAGEKILIACPGKKVTNLKEEVIAECKSGTTFVVDNKQYDLSQLACTQHPTHVAEKTNEPCGENGRGRLAQIGHKTSRGLVVLSEVCFYQKTLEALYTAAIVSGSIGGARSGVSRPSFITGSGFYGSVNPNTYYGRSGQKGAFASLLGSKELANKYISETNDYYMARGHLAAKADFVWGQQQRATFYYINAAPQWQTFNGGNWEQLESSVRHLAAKRERDLLVITGTWDRAILPDSRDRDTELYIDADGLIPVPALYWKVVFDETTGEGAAFVGVNNPYTTLAAEKRLQLCSDVCSAISWVTWEPSNVRLGEGYCCTVDDLRSAVPDVPDLPVKALLAKV